ncbi:primosomal protein N' [Marinivivus vitaminiproducens]|uniref:primosomal protein N' n=1 Tax=Marinivivus vitaminiproducens TaxID=3035935 RepID=UPI00279F7084|nr:primosomal protein N' [Geminicoccaceae bacterium SCSIO 64248]
MSDEFDIEAHVRRSVRTSRASSGRETQGALFREDEDGTARVSDSVPVLVPVPLDGPFDYLASAPGGLPPGTLVEVPFGPRSLPGVVWDERSPRPAAPARLKTIGRVLDAPPMPPALRRLVAHVARETVSPLGSVLKLALSTPSAFEPETPRPGYVLDVDAAAALVRVTPTRRKAIAAADPDRPTAAAEIARRAGVGAGVVKLLIDQGVLRPQALPEAPASLAGTLPDGPVLSPEQRAAADDMIGRVERREAGALLLDGVPGAGKTEVYFEAIAAAVRAGRQALVLLPEIALSAQWLDRFAARFGAPPALWHSELTSMQRRRTWRRIARGHEPVVVGARSALFLPLDRLGLIVVDEEHDASFKQSDGVTYHARDMALARARFEACPAVLATATPALETALAAGLLPAGPRDAAPAFGYRRLSDRHNQAPLPRIDLIDLKSQPPPKGAWLSPPLRQALASALEQGAQALFFLNRRGYAPLTLCRACGHRLACPNCSAWLVEHRLRGRLQCHHCGYGRPVPEHCPACGGVDSLVACGPGVERVAVEIQDLHPGARIGVMASDTPGGPGQARALVRAMQRHELDILIGTQLIAKGHHFPDLALVGVIDGDLGLAGGDLRAGERSFQLLYQVAGRAGREERTGRVLIQTWLPGHPIMQALRRGDRDRFLRAEIDERRSAGMPPCGRLAALVVQGPDPATVLDTARRLARAAPEREGLRVLGPAPAPLALLRGRHRQRLLVKAAHAVDLPLVLGPWLQSVRPGPGVRVAVDVDPYSFL